MKPYFQLSALLLFLGINAHGLTPVGVPRLPTQMYFGQGLFTGGQLVSANIEGIRLAQHKNKGYERWVIDFSSTGDREVGAVAPRFQLAYLPGTPALKPESLPPKEGKIHPPKFRFLFQNIQNNFLTQPKITRLIKRSDFVSEIVVYPPIENGDLAMEFVLNQEVQFEPHQPIEREGRLVLDIKMEHSRLTP